MMSDLLNQGRGSTERGNLMAIPADGDNHPYSQTEQCNMEFDDRQLPDSLEEGTISVRLKGKGREIRINTDCGKKQADSPVVATRFLQETGSETDTQSGPAVIQYRTDVRGPRKRSHSTNTKTSGEKPYFSPDLVPLTPNFEFNAQPDIKSTSKLKTKHTVPLKKRKRPDSPLKNRFLKSYDQSSDAVTPETMGKVLQLWGKEGVTLYGQKYEIHLFPVQGDPPADGSYLKRHNFSPGSEVFSLSAAKTPCPVPELKSTSGFMDMKEDTDLPIVHEEPLPAVGSVEPVPTVVQDSPLDLSSKSMLAYQTEPIDYTRGPLDCSTGPPDDSTEPLDCSTGPPDDSTGPLDYSNRQPHETVTSTADMANMSVIDDSSLQIVDTINKSAHTSFKQEDADQQENLPSLEYETMNLNLGRETLPITTYSAQQNVAVLSPEILIGLLARLDALKKQPVSWTQPSNADPSYNPDNQIPGVVPNLVDLDMTDQDGTIIQSKNDILKSKLKQKIQGE